MTLHLEQQLRLLVLKEIQKLLGSCKSLLRYKERGMTLSDLTFYLESW